MPTFTHGKKTEFYISDGTTAVATGTVSSANVYKISEFCKEVSFPSQMDTAETSTFGTGTKTFVQGLRSGTLSISGSFSSSTVAPTATGTAKSIDQILSGLIGAANDVAFVYGPEGNATGKIKYSGQAILTSYQVNGSLGDIVAFSAEFQVSGDTTRGTF